MDLYIQDIRWFHSIYGSIVFDWRNQYEDKYVLSTLLRILKSKNWKLQKDNGRGFLLVVEKSDAEASL